jgi:hypothetical protein
LSVCAKTPRPLDLTVREGLLRLATLYDRDVTEPMKALWMESLAGLDPRLAEAAFREVEKTFVPTMACPFPVPAHVRNLLKDAQSMDRTAEAELAWQNSLAVILHLYHPDIGWHGTPLEGRELRAAEAAGGLRYLFTAPDDKLVWAKKAFVEAYLREEQLLEAAPLLPEVRNLLAEAVQKQNK